MTGGHEYDDEQARDDEERERCPNYGTDDVTYGPGYFDNLLALSDATVGDDLLGALLPLDGRWPEPRALDQDAVFFLADRTRVDVAGLDAEDAVRLLGHLRDLAPALHGRACADEALTVSSGLRRAMAHAGVALVSETDPLVWLEASVLVRALRRLGAGAAGVSG